MTNLIVTEPDHLVDLIKKTVRVALKEHEEEKKIGENMRLLTVAQVSRRLHKAHLTVSRMIKKGVLHATKDGLVPEVELQKYINGK
jgi:hypothetical protein